MPISKKILASLSLVAALAIGYSSPSLADGGGSAPVVFHFNLRAESFGFVVFKASNDPADLQVQLDAWKLKNPSVFITSSQFQWTWNYYTLSITFRLP